MFTIFISWKGKKKKTFRYQTFNGTRWVEYCLQLPILMKLEKKFILKIYSTRSTNHAPRIYYETLSHMEKDNAKLEISECLYDFAGKYYKITSSNNML